MTLLTNREDMMYWLNEHDIYSYKIIEDVIHPDRVSLAVDVEGSVDLSDRELKSIGVQFNSVGGDFNCQRSRLTSLLGAPRVVGWSVDFGHNLLESLEGGPQVVGGSFFVPHNHLKSLWGGPKSVGMHFNCSQNYLESLQHITVSIPGYLMVSENRLKNLEFLPTVGSKIFCGENPRLREMQKIQDPNLLRVMVEKRRISQGIAVPALARKIIKL